MWTIYVIVPPDGSAPRVLVVDAHGNRRCDSECLNCAASWLVSIGQDQATIRFASGPDGFAAEGLDLSGKPHSHLDRAALGRLERAADDNPVRADAGLSAVPAARNRRERRPLTSLGRRLPWTRH